MIEKEVKKFVDEIQAELCPLEHYRGNLFYKNGVLFIIKVSRTDKKFYGVNGKLLDLLIKCVKEKDIHFSIVLLGGNMNRIYTEKSVIAMINRGKWKQSTKTHDYKINEPFENSLLFGTAEDFLRLLDMHYAK